MEIVMYLLFVLCVLGIGYRIYLVSQSMQARKMGRADVMREKLASQGREEFWAGLPLLPWQTLFTRGHGRIPKAELADETGASLLALFEAKVLDIASPRMFVAAHKFGNGRSTFVVGYYTGFFTTLRSVVTIEERGSMIEYNLMFGEFRFFRDPRESDSHYCYSLELEHQKHSNVDANTGFVMALWDGLFSNIVTQEGAKHTEFFERFIKECWAEAIEMQQPRFSQRLSTPFSAPKPTVQNVTAASNPTQRPTRRD